LICFSKNKQQVHVSKENKLLVTESEEHKQYPCPSPENTKNARPEAFKPKYCIINYFTLSHERDDKHLYHLVWSQKKETVKGELKNSA
jgi:hypothetical protein